MKQKRGREERKQDRTRGERRQKRGREEERRDRRGGEETEEEDGNGMWTH